MLGFHTASAESGRSETLSSQRRMIGQLSHAAEMPDCQVTIHAFTIPPRHAGLSMDVSVFESFLEVNDYVVPHLRQAVARFINFPTEFVPEHDTTVQPFLANKPSLMNQPVMEATQLYQVVQTCLTAVGPVLYVVSVNEMLMRTARKAAIPVSCPQCASHWWWNDSRFAPDRQRFALVILDNSRNRAVTADSA